MQDRLQQGWYYMYQIDGTLLWQLAVIFFFLQQYPAHHLYFPGGQKTFLLAGFIILIMSMIGRFSQRYIIILMLISELALVVVGASSFFQML